MSGKSNEPKLRRRAASTESKERPPVAEPRPSASIILLSPTNQVLLLHRVQTSSAFPSAHVFPGGNLSSFHETGLPKPGSPERHQDGLSYRLGAIRETFEESGILLARAGKSKKAPLLDVPIDAREQARKDIYENKIRFTDWLASLGGVPDVDGLVPFTRWVTPPNVPKRFTTQMYLYMLPLADKSTAASSDEVSTAAGVPKEEAIVHTPTSDGGVEHTAATFDEVSTWLARQTNGEIILFPPQLFLLTLLSGFIKPSADSTQKGHKDYARERKQLLSFLSQTPSTSPGSKAANHPTANISWADKVISPHTLFIRRRDGRVVLGLDKPGLELKDSGRGGDWERVVLVRFQKEGPREVEVRNRENVLREEKVAQALESKM